MHSKFIFHHTTPVQIRFNDFDSLRHINNSVYQNYYDLARTDYIEQVFKEKMDWDNKGVVLVKVTIEFIRPILPDDTVVVKTKIYKIGNKSFGMFQQILNPHTGELKSTCDSVMVSYCQGADKPCPMPIEWRERIAKFEKDIQF